MNSPLPEPYVEQALTFDEAVLALLAVAIEFVAVYFVAWWVDFPGSLFN